MLRSKLQTSGASPAVWKSSSFLCCCHHSPSVKLPSGVGSTPVGAHQSPGLCACGRQSQCAGMGINAVLRQFRKSAHICFACVQSWFSCNLPSQKPVCLCCLALFLHVWSFVSLPPRRAHILKKSGCLRFENC